MTRLPFFKMTGCGNDYVFLDTGWGSDAVGETQLGSIEDLSIRISDRHNGVGADGLILLDEHQGGPRMRMWNADGSVGRLCLNGLREAALLAVNLKPEHALSFTMATDAGPRAVNVLSRGRGASVVVRTAPAEFRRDRIPAEGAGAELWGESVETSQGSWEMHALSVGNPHAVIWLPFAQLGEAPLETIGTAVQQSGLFPEGVNVHLASVAGQGTLMFRPWERGSGATRACGSGAVAVYAAAQRLGLAAGQAAVVMPGGTVQLKADSDGFELTGPAEEVFRGEWPLGPGSAPAV